MDKEYITKSQNAHRRLAILREQADAILAKAHPSVSVESIGPIIKRMGEICDELSALDKGHQGKT